MWDNAEKYLRKDKYIAPLIQKWGHCTIKPIKRSIYFEDLVDAICSQQLSGSAATTIFNRVKEKVGVLSADSILNAGIEDLRACGLSYAKIKYVKDLSKHVVSKKLNISKLDSYPNEEVIRQLCEVKGIGRWTAEMFLMFSLARADVFPVDDLGIKKGFEKVTGKTWDKIKSAKYAEKHWKPYRTFASWYLWRSLENR
jgi:DNA-3-methyladenine glycosylase II